MTTPREDGTGEAAKDPRPTFWPAATAFGITLLAWSLVSSGLVGVVGGVVLAGSLAGWISEALRTSPRSDGEP